MNIGSVGAQGASRLAGMTRSLSVVGAEGQAAAAAEDPFATYLSSLTQPEAILRAALVQTVTGKTGSQAAASAILAANALRVVALTGAGTAGLVQATDALAAGAADRLDLAQATAGAAQAGVSGPAGEVAAGTTASAPAATGTQEPSAAPDTTQRVAEDLAALTAQSAARNAEAAASTVLAVSRGASALATDATAKYMGAGALAQNQGPGSAAAQAAAAYQALQEAIPAVLAAPASPPLSANTGSTRQGYTPAQPALAPLRRGTGRGPAPFETLDLTG